MSRFFSSVLAFACAALLGMPLAHADDDEPAEEPATGLETVEGESLGRSWIGFGYYRSAAQTHRGPATHDGKLLMALNFALDVSRKSYSLELVPRAFNEATTPGSRTFNFLLGPNLVRTDYERGALIDGFLLRARFVKYLAHGETWRFGAGLALSDLVHVAHDDIEKNVRPYQDAWFISAGPVARLDLLVADSIQVRLGAAAAVGVFDLKDAGGKRPYALSPFVHVLFPYHLFFGAESTMVVGVPHVFSQRHELQFGFFG